MGVKEGDGERVECRERKTGIERERERRASALVIHLFCVCACLCGSVGGYRCQAARLYLYPPTAETPIINSILTRSLEVTVLSLNVPQDCSVYETENKILHVVSC